MIHDRCMHGMIKGQCGICRKWSERSHAKKAVAGTEKTRIAKTKQAKA